MADIADRIFNPAIILTMIGSGIAYGYWLLWAINIRDVVRLWGGAVMPGVVFLLIITAVRFLQGTTATVYLYLTLDWLFFSNAAFLTVLARRWWTRRSHLRNAKEGKQ